LEVVKTYTGLGIEHILSGFDHLLYVLGMLILVGGWRRIVATMSAFTATHSLTLTAAALGWVHVPQPPVEACIALSILFVAREIVQVQRGRPGITARWPWVVSFTFGLMHGFGFAGALAEVGLPQSSIPIALLFFNVGVEIGQLMFVAAVLTAVAVGWRAAQRLRLLEATWLVRNDEPNGAVPGLGSAMLLYNSVALAVLASAAAGSRLVGILTWPAIALHAALAIWCIESLRSGQRVWTRRHTQVR